LNPMAEAPASTAASASSRLVIPQTFTITTTPSCQERS
jgi:hypothetical protein